MRARPHEPEHGARPWWLKPPAIEIAMVKENRAENLHKQLTGEAGLSWRTGVFS